MVVRARERTARLFHARRSDIVLFRRPELAPVPDLPAPLCDCAFGGALFRADRRFPRAGGSGVSRHAVEPGHDQHDGGRRRADLLCADGAASRRGRAEGST